MLLVVCGFVVSFWLCVFFQCFSTFSSLCSCVGQALFGRIKIVYVTDFFVMKNVFCIDGLLLVPSRCLLEDSDEVPANAKSEDCFS